MVRTFYHLVCFHTDVRLSSVSFQLALEQVLWVELPSSTISHRLTGHLSNFFPQRRDTVEWVPGNVPGIEDTHLKSELEPLSEFIRADFAFAEYISAIVPKRG
jgi:hypothetical protein